MMTTTITGKSASELRTLRDAVRFDGIAPDGTTVRGPARYALAVELTKALAAVETPVVAAPSYRTCCGAAVVSHEAPYAHVTTCPCHGRRTHGTAD